MPIITTKSGALILVDDCDYEWVSQFSWFLDGKGYATRNSSVNEKHVMLLMHREILQPDAGVPCDHANGNRLDNRRCNLRTCTMSQNNGNRHVARSNSSQYLGVRRRPNRISKAWQARIRDASGKCKHLGYFSTEIEAALAYGRAAREIRGEFASPLCLRGEA